MKSKQILSEKDRDYIIEECFNDPMIQRCLNALIISEYEIDRLKGEIEELKQERNSNLPDECVSGWDEVKFCPHRLGDGNKCRQCI